MSILRDLVDAVCCCLPGEEKLEQIGIPRSLKRLSDWRAHPTLREYDLEKHLADGGFSEIWLVRSRLSGAEQCLKVVNLCKPGLLPEDVDILRGEARFLRLLDHPSLLCCRDVFETKYHMVMILEYLSGGQMLDHLHQVEHYSEAQAARLFAQVASAVAYMHNLNIVHRDIKPENVMFVRPLEECVSKGRSPRVKLIDLGMAAVLVPPETPEEAAAATRARKQQRRHGGPAAAPPPPRREAPRGCMGSPGFIAPEVIHGSVHTLSMDVYALGVLLFAMLTGRKPWSLKDSRNLSYAERSIIEAPGLKDPIFLSLSSAARELVLAMMADDPRVRPSSAEVLRHPFMTQSLSAGGGTAALDDVIKRRMAQLASLRRFRGLSFAMMASRQEGQDLADFTKQLTERRKAIHRDLLVRAKTRHSMDMERSTLQLAAGHQLRGNSGSVDRKKRPQQPPLLPQAPQLLRKRGAVPVAGNNPASPSEDRGSIDSACSQQPLLMRQQQQQEQEAVRDTQQSVALTNENAFNHCKQNQPQSTHLQVDGSRHSLDSSMASSVSSRQPLVGGGGGGVVAVPSHHTSHQAIWLAVPLGPPPNQGHLGAAETAGSGHRKSGSLQHPVRRSNSHHQQRHVLDTVAEPEEGPSGVEGAAAPLLHSQQQQPAAGASGAVRSRGWSITGRQNAAAPIAASTGTLPPLPPPQQQQLQSTSRSRRFMKDSELELAAVDPLALIRELPIHAMGSALGRAHSAPENLATSLLPLIGRGDVGGLRVASGGSHGATDALLDRVAMGADMRAVSANSWTLNFLENADLLAALTGVPLAHRISSASLDTSVHGGTATYGEALAAMISAARRNSGDAATTANAVLQRLRSDVSRGGGALSPEASAHQVMVAALAAARAGSSTHGGSATTMSTGQHSLPTWTVFATAATAPGVVPAETPTRSVAAGVNDRPAVDAAAAFNKPSLPPSKAAIQGDVTFYPSSGLHGKRTGQPRVLFGDCASTPPALPPPLDWADTSAVSPSSVSDIPIGVGLSACSGSALPLLRTLRHGDDPDGAGGGPSCDVKYTCLHLSTSSRQLGVALPMAAASPAAAAAEATVKATAPAAAAVMVSAAFHPALPFVRRPSLALVDVEDRIAAKRASLGERFHAGQLWIQLHGGGGSGSPAAESAAMTGASGDLSGHGRSSRLDSAFRGSAASQHSPADGALKSTPPNASPKWNYGLGLALQQELRALAQSASASPSGSALKSPPSLARITECSDLGDSPGPECGGDPAAAAAAVSARAGKPSRGQQPRKRLPTQPTSETALSTRASKGAPPAGKAGEAPDAAPPAPRTHDQAAGCENRWRSPFEALAVEPNVDAGSAKKPIPGADR
ncbi:hypothetical protein VaNZ11_002889 [Volvox africanus]|uniref:Protein kinase domain-containing protein n=1 Tax=Volvox africanus TaxID=51714 RepID=A0ABQ5RSZ4_9CHLO|nr:hypothetical protein VaNZ11_002889 [Volvox africanus]